MNKESGVSSEQGGSYQLGSRVLNGQTVRDLITKGSDINKESYLDKVLGVSNEQRVRSFKWARESHLNRQSGVLTVHGISTGQTVRDLI